MPDLLRVKIEVLCVVFVKDSKGTFDLVPFEVVHVTSTRIPCSLKTLLIHYLLPDLFDGK